jgi:hypothetical protein
MQNISYRGNNKNEPGITIPLYDEWYEMRNPEITFGIIKNKGKGNFSPNISLTVLEDSKDSSLEITTIGVNKYLETLTPLTVITNAIGAVNGRPWHIAEFSTNDSTVGGILQIIATTVEKVGDVTYVFRFTGTALQEDLDTDFIELRKIISSIKINK